MPPLPNAKHELVAQHRAAGNTWEDSLNFAGYSPISARHNQNRLMANDGIQSRISELQEQHGRAKLVTAFKLHERWSEMFEADIADICTPDRKLKPLHEWPKIWRQMLSGVDVKELSERSKDGGEASWDKIGEVVKLKFIAQKDLGELLGRHKAVDAFVKQVAQIDVNVNISEDILKALAEGRERASQLRLVDKVG